MKKQGRGRPPKQDLDQVVPKSVGLTARMWDWIDGAKKPHQKQAEFLRELVYEKMEGEIDMYNTPMEQAYEEYKNKITGGNLASTKPVPSMEQICSDIRSRFIQQHETWEAYTLSTYGEQWVALGKGTICKRDRPRS